MSAAFFLLSCFELPQEPDIVLGEHAQVFYLVFQIGDALYPHPESIAGINFRVDATVD